MSAVLRFRWQAGTAVPSAVWPSGTALLPLASVDPRLLHAILSEAYATGFGEVSPFDEWWPALTGDPDFDPDLLLIAATDDAQPIGLIQCWTSGFIKDLAVRPDWRGKGIASALLLTAFGRFRARGIAYVDLKVRANNVAAIALYRRLGMVPAPL